MVKFSRRKGRYLEVDIEDVESFSTPALVSVEDVFKAYQEFVRTSIFSSYARGAYGEPEEKAGELVDVRILKVLDNVLRRVDRYGDTFSYEYTEDMEYLEKGIEEFPEDTLAPRPLMFNVPFLKYKESYARTGKMIHFVFDVSSSVLGRLGERELKNFILNVSGISYKHEPFNRKLIVVDKREIAKEIREIEESIGTRFVDIEYEGGKINPAAFIYTGGIHVYFFASEQFELPRFDRKMVIPDFGGGTTLSGALMLLNKYVFAHERCASVMKNKMKIFGNDFENVLVIFSDFELSDDEETLRALTRFLIGRVNKFVLVKLGGGSTKHLDLIVSALRSGKADYQLIKANAFDGSLVNRLVKILNARSYRRAPKYGGIRHRSLTLKKICKYVGKLYTLALRSS